MKEKKGQEILILPLTEDLITMKDFFIREIKYLKNRNRKNGAKTARNLFVWFAVYTLIHYKINNVESESDSE
jgi:hypothetical protein